MSTPEQTADEGPVVEDLTKSAEPAKAPVAEAVAATVAASTEPTFAEPEEKLVLSADETTNTTTKGGTVVTAIMIERIERHMKFLTGHTSFRDKEQEVQEQVTFIETIGNTFQLDYPQYQLVTDTLVEHIRNNLSVFADNQAFRFIPGLEKVYPAVYIQNYQKYISILTQIAKFWNRRSRLKKMMDVTTLVTDFNSAAKANIDQYVNYLSDI